VNHPGALLGSSSQLAALAAHLPPLASFTGVTDFQSPDVPTLES
jgi:hypothetical protein